MTEETIIGLWQLACRANGDPYARALLDEIRRLYQAAADYPAAAEWPHYTDPDRVYGAATPEVFAE